MDKPLGPRQPPPDKRHAAYQSIFGRPGVSHHHPHSYHPDRRTSPFSPSPYPTHHYYPSPGPSSNPHTYPSYPSSLLPPDNPALSRANSTNSPAPYLPQNIIHDSVPLSGLTPAQTYQAQVYMNGPNGNSISAVPPRDWPATSPAPPDRRSHPPAQNAGSSFLPDPPKLGISLEHDDGRLGIDFISGNEDDPLDIGQDESASELPWARVEHTSTHPFLFPSIRYITHSPPPLF